MYFDYDKLEKFFGKGCLTCILTSIAIVVFLVISVFITASRLKVANIVAHESFPVNLTVFVNSAKNGTTKHLIGFGYLQRN